MRIPFLLLFFFQFLCWIPASSFAGDECFGGDTCVVDPATGDRVLITGSNTKRAKDNTQEGSSAARPSQAESQEPSPASQLPTGSKPAATSGGFGAPRGGSSNSKAARLQKIEKVIAEQKKMQEKSKKISAVAHREFVQVETDRNSILVQSSLAAKLVAEVKSLTGEKNNSKTTSPSISSSVSPSISPSSKTAGGISVPSFESERVSGFSGSEREAKAKDLVAEESVGEKKSSIKVERGLPGIGATEELATKRADEILGAKNYQSASSLEKSRSLKRSLRDRLKNLSRPASAFEEESAAADDSTSDEREGNFQPLREVFVEAEKSSEKDHFPFGLPKADFDLAGLGPADIAAELAAEGITVDSHGEASGIMSRESASLFERVRLAYSRAAERI